MVTAHRPVSTAEKVVMNASMRRRNFQIGVLRRKGGTEKAGSSPVRHLCGAIRVVPVWRDTSAKLIELLCVAWSCVAVSEV